MAAMRTQASVGLKLKFEERGWLISEIVPGPLAKHIVNPGRVRVLPAVRVLVPMSVLSFTRILIPVDVLLELCVSWHLNYAYPGSCSSTVTYAYHEQPIGTQTVVAVPASLCSHYAVSGTNGLC
eukprot:1186920-Rhodomonas_salina.3